VARLKLLLAALLVLFGLFGASSGSAPVVADGPSASAQHTLSDHHAVLRVAAAAPAPHTWWAVQPPAPAPASRHRAGRVQDAPSTRSAVSLPTSQSTRAPPAR
jgi:hypothetical protein